jgi:hypothetical protein
MIRHICPLALAVLLTFPVTLVGQGVTGDAPSPELVGQLAKQLGSSEQQAIGAAGSLFGLAKMRMKPADFSKVAAAVPGMNGMLAAAPAMAAAMPAGAGALGMTGGLAGVGGAFSKLGLKPDQVGVAASLLTKYVTKSGGPAVGALLAGALK